MDRKLVFVGVFLLGLLYANGSSIAQREEATDRKAGGGEAISNTNYKRQFVFYPNGNGYGHHHHHHHQYNEGFFDAEHGGEVIDDGYQDHGNMEEMDVPHYEHVHHQYKHIHHVGKTIIAFSLLHLHVSISKLSYQAIFLVGF